MTAWRYVSHMVKVSLRSMAVLSNRAQERRSHEKFAREARENERQSREKNKNCSRSNLLAVSLPSPAFIT